MFELIESEKRLLIIDDRAATTDAVLELFSEEYRCVVVETLRDGLQSLHDQEFGVILCNVAFVSREGRRVIAKLRDAAPFSPIILFGETPDAAMTIELFRSGTFDFLPTPFERNVATATVTRALEEFETRLLRDRYQGHLENLAAERATAIDKALDEVESSYRITLKALVQALETRDFETHGHSERVVTFSLRLGFELGLEKDQLRDLELGALLHDIGKIGVPDAILRKPAALNDEEWRKMKLHPLHGQKILRTIRFLDGAARVVAQHHERWDGAGYPYGLRGEDIDIGARIFAVVDAFDAITSDRVYRAGRSYQDALDELERCAGSQFDPLIVEAFKAIPREDWETLRERSLTESPDVTSFQSVVEDLVYAGHKLDTIH